MNYSFTSIEDKISFNRFRAFVLSCILIVSSTIPYYAFARQIVSVHRGTSNMNKTVNKKPLRPKILNKVKKEKSNKTQIPYIPVPESSLGLNLWQEEDRVFILTIYPGSLADKIGFQKGDIITDIDGVHISKLEEANNLLVGKPGSKVKVSLLRDSSPLNIEATRETVEPIDYVIRIESDIPYVKIYKFSHQSIKDFRTDLQAVVKNNPKGLILDLRDNPGGLVNSIEPVVSSFVKKGSSFARLDLDKPKKDVYSEYKITIQDPIVPGSTKVIVLVNQYTFAAAEVVAGALKEILTLKLRR